MHLNIDARGATIRGDDDLNRLAKKVIDGLDYRKIREEIDRANKRRNRNSFNS